MEEIPHTELAVQVQHLIKAMDAVQKLLLSLDEELRWVNTRLTALEKIKPE